MKIAFYVSRLGLRGNTNAVALYADYAQRLFGHSSSIILKLPRTLHDRDALDAFARSFELLFFEHAWDLEELVQREQIDLFYAIKPGFNDGISPTRCRSVIHCMNLFSEQHGDRMAFVSKWHAQHMSAGGAPYVPHIIEPLANRGDLRHEFKIPEDAVVIGRHGDPSTFDIPWVREALITAAQGDRRLYFLLLNTPAFCSEPNVVFLPGTFDRDFKAAFLHSCDAMLHARSRGETFGLAVADFAGLGKPVMTWSGCPEKGHFDLLGAGGRYYSNYHTLLRSISQVRRGESVDYGSLQSEYGADAVMRKFAQVFLN